MRYPKSLSKEGCIGFVAPSFGCATEPYKSAFEQAQKNFSAMGHSLWLGPNCYAAEGIGISNTPQKCGEELTAAYCGEESDVLISCGGGELMCETLDFVDFEAIKKAKPKWYLGYSDNTHFTYLLPTLCDIAAIYGPCAAAFGMKPWHPSLTDAYELLRGEKSSFAAYPLWEKESLKSEENPLAPYHVTEPRILHTFCAGKEIPQEEVEWSASGRLLGGCLDCLVNLLGTTYDKTTEFVERYKEDGILWFWESCDLNVMAIRRAVWQMKRAGWFRYVKGFLIGRPYCFGQEIMGLDQYHAVVDLLAEYSVPVVMDLDFGHLPPMMPLVCGADAQVEVKKNEMQIRYAMTDTITNKE
ncbi:MAG: LD-carboxypeptidase [bacterium]|nr:LD-carboxypeptidase [bacterium]